MSSQRPHLRHDPQQHDDPTTRTPRYPSRIPTKSVALDGGNQKKPVQHVSKLAKRSNKSVKSLEPSVKSSTTRTATPMATATQDTVGSSRALSVTPSGATILAPPHTTRTPSLVSGSSASTFDSPRSTLRRKPSGAIDRYAAQKRANAANAKSIDRATMSSRNEVSHEEFDDTVLGISLPRTFQYDQYQGPVDASLQTFNENLTRNFTPPTHSGYAPSATPSTRYTDSPFSHAPTPSSASSYSPALIATTANAPQSRQFSSPSRSRPPITARDASQDEVSRLGLPPVRESSTSSSTSTVKTEAKLAHARKQQAQISRNAHSLETSSNQRTALPSARKARDVALSSTSRVPVQVPPELAHLNVELPSKTSLTRSPPPRPSRDGTSNIADMNKPSPVVHSELNPVYTTYHKRTPSQETPVSPSSPSLKTRFGMSSRSSSRTESPRIDSAVSPPPAARQFHRGGNRETKSTEPAKLQKLQRKDSPAIGTSDTPKKSSRFGFLSRKSKAEDEKTSEKPKRQPTKGPAAGTGHEGYGRWGVRGRTGSMSSNSAGLRSPSTDSGSSKARRLPPPSGRKTSIGSNDGSDLDDFLRERLNPVVLRGSGSTFSNTTSNSDLRGAASIYPVSSNSSSLDSVPAPQLLSSVMREARNSSPMKRPPLTRALSSESSQDEVARQPNLATRRSLTRMSSADSRSPVRMPPRINTDIPLRYPSIDSYDASASAVPQTDSSLPPPDVAVHGREGHWLASPSTSSPVKTGRRWNFFQRATSSPRPKGKEKAHERAVAVESAIYPAPPRNVLHYGMLGPVESIGLEEVERIAQENETDADESQSEINGPSRMVPYERRHRSLLPSPSKGGNASDSDLSALSLRPSISISRQDSSESPELLRAKPALAHQTANMVNIFRSPKDSFDLQRSGPPAVEFERPAVSTPEPQQRSTVSPETHNESPYQPRLSPVGRIPPVVSRRDRDRRLPDNSFSRPFARSQPRPSVKPPGSVYNQIREMASPIESNSQPVSSTSTRSDGNSYDPKSSVFTNPPSTSTNRTSMDIHAQDGFLAFPPRKYSEQSYSTSSGHGSWTTTLYNQPQQEDVWNEYNDFMDEMMPLKMQAATLKTPTTGSSLGAPFQYSGMTFDSNNAAGLATVIARPPSSQLPLPPTIAPTYTVLSVPEQITQYLQPSPLTPDSIFGFSGSLTNATRSSLTRSGLTSTAHRSTSSTLQAPRTSIYDSRDSIASSLHSGASQHSRSTSLPQATAHASQASTMANTGPTRDAYLRNVAEIPGHEQGASPNLRIGALMTSKWLFQGRVLFSPAPDGMHLADEPRVLVVDGLSSDWSYYIAFSYPEAEVYNLTPSSPGSPSFSWPDSNEKPPANHHQITSKSTIKFPFTNGYFTTVVFRFPKASTEKAYASCISECKRVLRPGGFLEVTVLDLDLMNMGNKARSAVKGLKTRIQQRAPEVSLRNLSDVVLREIGRRGFEEVHRAPIGIPAAGRIPRSQDMSSVSSGSSGRPRWHREGYRSKSQEFSLADLLEDSSTHYEKITKMTAKVGRWWYSTCYEKALLPTDQSIWTDSTLLRECEKQGTTFRLLICHAQKPTQSRRRTVSV